MAQMTSSEMRKLAAAKTAKMLAARTPEQIEKEHVARLAADERTAKAVQAMHADPRYAAKRQEWDDEQTENRFGR